MKKTLLALLAISTMTATSANAAVVVTSTAATNPYTGPVPTYNFETAAPVTGGSIVNATVAGQHTRPFGSTGNFLSAGIIDGSPAVLSLSSFSRIGSISLLWGSIDTFNVLSFLDASNTVIFSITGLQLRQLNPIANLQGDVNRVATFTFTDLATQSDVRSVRFAANRNSFEVDNISIRAVPEPATWLTLIMGFFGLGFAMRKRKASPSFRVRFA
jgi:hypothetical protein